MNVSEISERSEYIKAHEMALREKKELEAKGLSAYPKVLEEVFPEVSDMNPIDLSVLEIPAERIVGLRSADRRDALSASFLPLHGPDTEFASKWMTLCHEHLSDTGIRDPIDCYEYLGDFYVSEGNKRVSVLRWFGALKIAARVRRVLPESSEDPRVSVYREFLDFYKDAKTYDIRFRRSGDYPRLVYAMGKKQGEEWNDGDRKLLSSAFSRFRKAFEGLKKEDEDVIPEEALLLFLKIHTYEELCLMDPDDIRKDLQTIWKDVVASSEPSQISVSTVPRDEKKSAISKLISGTPRHLNAAFICQQDEDRSTWTRGHIEGAGYLEEALKGQVSVRIYRGADDEDRAGELIDLAAEEGAEVIFTTTPPLIDATLSAAVRYPKIRFFNCSACQPLSSIKSYYCRTYEGKFITGMIAGALSENDLIGYIASYPIMGVPASINAFALGARMTNPRARVLLEWSCTEVDCVRKLREKGVRVISNRDIPVPDTAYLYDGYFGTFTLDEEGKPAPAASPVWVWGKLYENMIRSILSGNEDRKDGAVNYWWGMDSGAIDVAVSDTVPDGVKTLANVMTDRLKKGEFDIFGERMISNDGSVISDGVEPLGSLEILRMDRLMENVTGSIPDYDEIFPMSRALVRELGIHREEILPETEE